MLYFNQIGDEVKKSIVNCVNYAVGDGIKHSIVGRVSNNGVPNTIWDILNTELYNKINQVNCIADVTQRGSWVFLPVFIKNAGLICTLIRESRFKDIQDGYCKGKNKKHYLSCFVNTLNKELISPVEQISLIKTPVINSEHEYMSEVVNNIISDLKIERDIVKHHLLILFESKNYQLLSIRAAVINGAMDIVQNGEENWSKYITINESAIMDNASEYTEAANNPGRKLKLNKQGLSRKERKEKDIKVIPFIKKEEID